MAFVCGGLRFFDEINVYTVSDSFIEGVFCGYMKTAIFTQQCTVTGFGGRFNFRVLQEGESVIINFISHVTEEMSGGFSLNMLLEIFRLLHPINLPYVLGLWTHYKFICTKPKNHSFKSL